MRNEKKSQILLTAVAVIAGLAASTIIPGAAVAQSKPLASGSDTAIHQVMNGPEQDPNLPDLPYPMPNAPVRWAANGAGSPDVTFNKPYIKATYLGFNEKGSWLRNGDEGKTYIWNFKANALTLGAESDAGIPLDLRNPSNFMRNIIANRTGNGRSSTAAVANNNSGRRTPYIPPTVANDGNAQNSGETHTGIFSPGTSTNGAGMGATTQVKGTGATVRAGVLTFTISDPANPDNGKPVSYKVVRSAMAIGNPNTPKPAGNSGLWMGEDPKNSENVIQFFVQDNGTVAGTVMSGFAAQAMKRMMMATPQNQ